MINNHFFVVGAQRSGTTYLYHLLDEHPQIAMAQPMRPEPKFFLREDLASLTHADYQATYFADASPAQLYGEKSTSYIEKEEAAQHIAQWFPEAKLIFLLRNPIHRAISNYQFSQQNGIETASIEVAFLEETQRQDNYDSTRFSVSPFTYLQRGRYIDYLKMYENYFPRQNLLVYIFEEFVGNQALVQELYQELGVEASFRPASLSKKYNHSLPHADTLTAKLKAYLNNYFQQSNQALAHYMGRSLAMWSTDETP